VDPGLLGWRSVWLFLGPRHLGAAAGLRLFTRSERGCEERRLPSLSFDDGCRGLMQVLLYPTTGLF
jgi:hypothetical protein